MKIIAEAGVNHNGSLKLALKLIDAAKAAGADIVKFQCFQARALVTESAQKAEYQKVDKRQHSQYDMLKRLELPYSDFVKLSDYCTSRGIEFLCTAFDATSLDFLIDNTSLKRLKIPSGEITNAPFILQHARAGLPLILSTGMASLADIENALKVIAFGFLASNDERPDANNLEYYYALPEARELLKERVTVLHCTTEYPAPLKSVNLRAMRSLGQCFNLEYGYSDHTEGVTVAVAAAALGASLIEKHFTLDSSLEGPDHQASLEPDELQRLVQEVRDCVTALGSAVKAPAPDEIKNKVAARKSLVAAKSIAKGEMFSVENLSVKRPGNGVSPMNYWSYIGQVAHRDFVEDELID